MYSFLFPARHMEPREDSSFNDSEKLKPGYVKDSLYTPLFPEHILKLRARIIKAFAQLERDKLNRLRGQLDYRVRFA